MGGQFGRPQPGASAIVTVSKPEVRIGRTGFTSERAENAETGILSTRFEGLANGTRCVTKLHHPDNGELRCTIQFSDHIEQPQGTKSFCFPRQGSCKIDFEKPSHSRRRFGNPPTPVERVDGSPQLGLPSESLIKAEGFWDCYFWACCARCPKPCIFPVFLVFRAKHLRFA